MNRWLTIDHPYNEITLRMDWDAIKKAMYVAPLPRDDWDALAKAEAEIHHANYGANGWTDVMQNDGDEYLNRIWSECSMYVENEHYGPESLPAHVLRARTAKRVAQALALIAFGPEILLK